MSPVDQAIRAMLALRVALGLLNVYVGRYRARSARGDQWAYLRPQARVEAELCAARSAYVNGRISLHEFERRAELLIGAGEP